MEVIRKCLDIITFQSLAWSVAFRAHGREVLTFWGSENGEESMKTRLKSTKVYENLRDQVHKGLKTEHQGRAWIDIAAVLR